MVDHLSADVYEFVTSGIRQASPKLFYSSRELYLFSAENQVFSTLN